MIAWLARIMLRCFRAIEVSIKSPKTSSGWYSRGDESGHRVAGAGWPLAADHLEGGTI